MVVLRFEFHKNCYAVSKLWGSKFAHPHWLGHWLINSSYYRTSRASRDNTRRHYPMEVCAYASRTTYVTFECVFTLYFVVYLCKLCNCEISFLSFWNNKLHATSPSSCSPNFMKIRPCVFGVPCCQITRQTASCTEVVGTRVACVSVCVVECRECDSVLMFVDEWTWRCRTCYQRLLIELSPVRRDVITWWCCDTWRHDTWRQSPLSA